MSNVIFIRRQSTPAYNPLTLAWIAATGETDTIILNALNTFEAGLIANSLTTKFNAIYPFVGGNSTKHSFNFINTLNFQLTFFGSWIHSATGALPVSGAYANTALTPSTTLSLNDAHLSVYTRTNANVGVDIGSSVTFPTRHCYLSARVTGNYIGNIHQATNSLVANANSQGWFTTSRTGVTTLTGYKNGTSILASVDVSTARPTQPIWLGGRNLNGVLDNGSIREQAFASIGSGLTAGDVSTLYTLIQAMQTSLSRQV
jgi:hypothetical protein